MLGLKLIHASKTAPGGIIVYVRVMHDRVISYSPKAYSNRKCNYNALMFTPLAYAASQKYIHHGWQKYIVPDNGSRISLQRRNNGRDGVSNHDCLLNRLFIQANIKGNTKAPRHWPLCGEFTGVRWIPHTNGQQRGKCFHLMTSSCHYSIIVNKQTQYSCFAYTVPRAAGEFSNNLHPDLDSDGNCK